MHQAIGCFSRHAKLGSCQVFIPLTLHPHHQHLCPFPFAATFSFFLQRAQSALNLQKNEREIKHISLLFCPVETSLSVQDGRGGMAGASAGCGAHPLPSLCVGRGALSAAPLFPFSLTGLPRALCCPWAATCSSSTSASGSAFGNPHAACVCDTQPSHHCFLKISRAASRTKLASYFISSLKKQTDVISAGPGNKLIL